MLFRPQRGELLESLYEAVKLLPNKDDLVKVLLSFGHDATNENVSVKYYCSDSRTKWYTHIVTVKGQGVGFTDGPLEDECTAK